MVSQEDESWTNFYKCEIKDWRGAVVGLKKSCAEYRSGTKQESGSQNLTFRLDLILRYYARASLSLRI